MHYSQFLVFPQVQIPTALAAGNWIASKAREQAAQSGTRHAARNLRKQGVPFELALLILANTTTVREPRNG